MIERTIDLQNILKRLGIFPVVAILGPRQCGKTTLAKQVRYHHYFDLENPRDLARFDNPQLTLEDLKGTIVIDEIQRKADLFPLIRYLVDNNPNQKYLILGSASRDLIRQSSETLAGRINYYYLGGLRIHDIGEENIPQLWLRGGFPLSFISQTNENSQLWLESYINSYLERDIPQLGINIPSQTLRKFWIMLSHYHGQLLNYSELAKSFDVSDATVKKYIGILAGTFMVRTLQPWHTNVKKRIVKSPKLYIKDSGIFHALQSINTSDRLLSHPKLGASWEGFALEQIILFLNTPDYEVFFWRTHAGAELDLLIQKNGKFWGLEIKYTDAPRMTKSIHSALKDLSLAHHWIVYPGKDKYPLDKRVTALPLRNINTIDFEN